MDMEQSIRLYVQPAYNYKTREVEYAEVLVRGYSSLSSGVSKDDYDMYIIEETFKILYSYGRIDHPIGIRIKCETVSTAGICDRLFSLMDKYKISMNDIIIEIDGETDFRNDAVIFNLVKLRESGIKVALDDFGIDKDKSEFYSSLTSNIDILRVDKAFTKSKDSECEDSQSKILRVFYQLYSDFSIKNILNGIETKKQLNYIERLGYSLVQGFLYEKPMPLDEYLEVHEKEKKGLKA